MDRTFVALNVNDSQEEALNVFRKYDRAALPVVDSNGVLVGIVTSDDMLDVAEEEATEDIQKLGGMEALDEPYMRIPLLRMVQKRAAWLVILFLGEMLTATAMAGLQRRDREGRRAGAVSAADHFQRRQFRFASVDADDSRDGAGRSEVARLVSGRAKGIVSGLSLGLILGTIGFFRISLWQYLHIFSSPIYGQSLAGRAHGRHRAGGRRAVGNALRLDAAVFCADAALDPATSSAPFVATLVDVTGLIIYFSIALFILARHDVVRRLAFVDGDRDESRCRPHTPRPKASAKS